MPASVTVATVNNTPAGSGQGSQTHIIYAVNGALWWAFWLDSTDTTTLRCASSPDLVTWTARTSATVTTQGGSEGRNFSVAYANISSTDVVHIAHAATNSTSQNLRGSMSGTTITWSADNSEGSTPGASPDGTGSAIASDGTPFASNTSSGNLIGIKATNADTGSGWTTGWGSPATVFSTAAFAGSTALVAVASAHVLYLGDNGSSNKTWNNLRYSLYTSSFAASAAIRGSNLGTAQNPADWGWAKFSDTDVHVMMRTGSNTFEHFRWNGTSFSAGDTVDNLTTAGGQGVALSTDGTNVWAFTIASASGNDVYSNKWISGTGWAGWTAIGLASATRTKIGAYQVDSGNHICVYWTAGASTPFTLEAYDFSTSTTVTSSRSAAQTFALLATVTRSAAMAFALRRAKVAAMTFALSSSLKRSASQTFALYSTLTRSATMRFALKATVTRSGAMRFILSQRRKEAAMTFALKVISTRRGAMTFALYETKRRARMTFALFARKTRSAAMTFCLEKNTRRARMSFCLAGVRMQATSVERWTQTTPVVETRGNLDVVPGNVIEDAP